MAYSLIISRDPFHISDRTATTIQDNGRIFDITSQQDHNLPFIVLLNGCAVLRKDWGRALGDGDILAVIYLPRGGGGGGSNPMRAVVMLAAMAMAPYATTFLQGTLGTMEGMLASEMFVASNFSLVSSGIAFAGATLVNALIPSPKPPSNQIASALANPSPTYSLQSQGNMARIDAAIPVQYGMVKLFPDYASQPYVEYRGNDQYLYQLFCLGVGEFSFNQYLNVYIGDVPINDFTEVQSQIVYKNSTSGAISRTLTLFPSNVIMSADVNSIELAPARRASYSQLQYSYDVTITFDTAHNLKVGDTIYFSRNPDTFDYPATCTVSYVADNYNFRMQCLYNTGIDYGTATIDSAPINNNPDPTDTTIGGEGSDTTTGGGGSDTTTGGGSIDTHNFVDDHASYVSLPGYDQRITTYNKHPFKQDDNVTFSIVSYSDLSNVFKIIQIVSDTVIKITVDVYASEADAGTCIIQKYSNEFISNPINDTSEGSSDALWLGFDFIIPNGLYRTQDSSFVKNKIQVAVDIIKINNNNSYAGGWETVCAPIYCDATLSVLRFSEKVQVEPSRYKVRVRRITESLGDGNADNINFSGLRAYLAETNDFGDVTLLATIMKATSNLSLQESKRVNVLATRKIYKPVYHPDIEKWMISTQTYATSSIAWAIVDAIHNSEYGGGLSYDNIDIEGLATLDQIWEDNNDEFNGRFDNEITLWEAITKIARAGMAKPYLQGGKVYVYRDSQQDIPVALFSERNILKNTLSIDYLFPTSDTSDGVEVTYYDSDSKSRMVQATLETGSPTNPAKVTLFGVTDRDQAYRDGMYQAACNRYRRKTIKFMTEMEGFIPTPGDLIAIQHDMPSWGQSAEVINWDAANAILTVSEELTFNTGPSHFLAFRLKDGSINGPYQVTKVTGNNKQVTVSDPESMGVYSPYCGDEYERTHIAFGPGEEWRQLAKVVAVRPRGLYQVEIEAINDDAGVYDAIPSSTIHAPVHKTRKLPRGNVDFTALLWSKIDNKTDIGHQHIVADISNMPSLAPKFPISNQMIGTVPTLVGSIELDAGTYTPSANMGCGDPTYAATLKLKKINGTVLATVGGSAGGLQWRTASSGFTLSVKTQIDLILYTNHSDKIAFINGLTF